MNLHQTFHYHGRILEVDQDQDQSMNNSIFKDFFYFPKKKYFLKEKKKRKSR